MLEVRLEDIWDAWAKLRHQTTTLPDRIRMHPELFNIYKRTQYNPDRSHPVQINTELGWSLFGIPVIEDIGIEPGTVVFEFDAPVKLYEVPDA